MKNTGIVRKIDELGRIVIPKEIRDVLNIKEGNDLEIYIDNTKIILEKYEAISTEKDKINDFISSVDDIVNANIFITNSSYIITKGELENKKIPELFSNLLIDRKNYISNFKEIIKFENIIKEGYFYVEAIIKRSSPLGLIILYKKDKIEKEDLIFCKIIKKIIEKK